MSADLLVELFTEELPPKDLRSLGMAFGDKILGVLSELRFMPSANWEASTFASPRRLAVLISAVMEKSAERTELRKLMPSKAAFDAAGKPSAALLKKLEKEGGDIEHIERRTEGNMEYVFLTLVIPGISLEAALQGALQEAIAKLPIPKAMSYQLADGTTTVKFVRPAHGLVVLHDEKVLAVTALGLTAGRVTHGHRFQGAKDIVLERANEYESRLETEGQVIPNFDKRRSEIEKQLADKAHALLCSLGAEADYEPLLDEVTALVEYPTVYLGEFESDFLAVPQECLILTMRQNQKYFPLFDANGKLTNRFLIVSNMRLTEARTIIEGNQRVVRPRLADARFFFDTDLKTRLADQVQKLRSVVYHNELGSQFERVARLRALAGSIAKDIGADPALAEQAAHLAKADLVTNMVGEFPELQGIMGRYYALCEGADERIAFAIEDHYKPRFAGDQLPRNDVGVAVALADKLDTLVGLFGIGQVPTGDKDPYALRRHALGVIRILIDKDLRVGLGKLIGHAVNTARAAWQAKRAESRLKKLEAGIQERTAAHGPESFPPTDDAIAKLIEFIYERLKGVLRDGGYTPQEIDAVVSLRPEFLADVPKRLAAVRVFTSLPEAQSLAAANKRVANILKQAEAKGETFVKTEVAEFKVKAEHDLFDALRKAAALATPLLDQGDYTGYLKTFAVLKSPVDAYFESVMVMVEDKALRQNRLALLRDLREEMNRIADISKLAT